MHFHYFYCIFDSQFWPKKCQNMQNMQNKVGLKTLQKTSKNTLFVLVRNPYKACTQNKQMHINSPYLIITNNYEFKKTIRMSQLKILTHVFMLATILFFNHALCAPPPQNPSENTWCKFFALII